MVEAILGKLTRSMDAVEFSCRMAGYNEILVDLGTGDGKFVVQAARKTPGLFAIGVDASRENLRETSRSAPGNALFVIANACALPAELTGQATWLTVNFPWGSLRDGLLSGDPGLLDGLRALLRPGALVEVRLNASALAEAGWELDAGGQQVYEALLGAGLRALPPRRMDANGLRACPTTWAKRLAYGRAPEAVYIRAALARVPQGVRVNTWNSSMVVS